MAVLGAVLGLVLTPPMAAVWAFDPPYTDWEEMQWLPRTVGPTLESWGALSFGRAELGPYEVYGKGFFLVYLGMVPISHVIHERFLAAGGHSRWEEWTWRAMWWGLVVAAIGDFTTYWGLSVGGRVGELLWSNGFGVEILANLFLLVPGTTLYAVVAPRRRDARRRCAGADLDAPWLFDGESNLLVNGVDVIPLVEAEFNRRFPGRADRRAGDPAGLRAAWATLERTWAATLERVAVMPAGTVEVSIGGEWSFAQTLRHLVMATDAWLGRAILEIEQPFHPIGQPNAEYETDGNDLSIFTTDTPSYAEVLEARAGRLALVRDFLTTVTSEELAVARRNPWDRDCQETTLSCLHVILVEEWEHNRSPYATSRRSRRSRRMNR